ncbi:RNA-directed DNA polymerase, eukaryota, nucleotide-binding alpha-beta plait domain protein [Tanacetum coccineum]
MKIHHNKLSVLSFSSTTSCLVIPKFQSCNGRRPPPPPLNSDQSTLSLRFRFLSLPFSFIFCFCSPFRFDLPSIQIMVFPKSNEDHTKKISHSVYVTNFPDATQSGDLWKVCSAYGTVIDVYIPNKRAKSGKRFAFVRFIKVSNLARLLENLCTIWIGRYHLYANQVRFERPQKHNSSLPKETSGIPVKVPNSLGPNHPARPVVNRAPSFATMLAGIPKNPSYISPDPAMVLGDECVVNRELDNCVMGEVKDFASINNLYVLLSNEGFQELKLVYLGGLWVMIELSSSKAKSGFMKHVGIASWFRQLRNAQADFVSRERIVWVDIEGVPLHVWSRATFSKIGSR